MRDSASFGHSLRLVPCEHVRAFRERAARSESAASLKGVQTIETVRLQIMLNRLNLDNFLLSGDPRDEEKVNKGITELTDTLKQGEAQAATDVLRTTLLQVEARKSVGLTILQSLFLRNDTRSTLAIPRFQICRFFTSRKIPLSWLTKSSILLDQTTQEYQNVDETTKSAAKASAWSSGITTAAHFWPSCSESV